MWAWSKNKVPLECSYAVATWGISILCDYKAATKGNMNVHKQAKHEGIQYSCDQFIKLDCDQWECKLKHKGIVYSCDQCDCKAPYKHAFRIKNNQYTRISNLIVNNVNTKQQKRQSKSAHYIETWRDQILLWSMWVQMCAQTIETWKHCTSKLLGFINNISTGTSNLIVINVSTRQQPKVIWESTHYRNMRGSYLIVYKTTQKSSLSNKSTQNQYMKESSIVVTSVTTKHRTSRIHKQSKHGDIKIDCGQC